MECKKSQKGLGLSTDDRDLIARCRVSQSETTKGFKMQGARFPAHLLH